MSKYSRNKYAGNAFIMGRRDLGTKKRKHRASPDGWPLINSRSPLFTSPLKVKRRYIFGRVPGNLLRISPVDINARSTRLITIVVTTRTTIRNAARRLIFIISIYLKGTV